MRDSTGRIITSKGPIRYNGLQLVKEELRTTLENGHSYYVHVEAQTVGQSTVSSSNVMFRTGIVADVPMLQLDVDLRIMHICTEQLL